MKCITAIGGVITAGIRLTRDTTPDGKTRHFVHVNPDHYGEVQSVEALLASGCAHIDGDDVVVDRCVYVGGDLQPETAPDGKVLVLGAIDQRHADFGAFDAPESYRTAIGPNVCFHAVVSRHNNRVWGKTTGHEEFAFLGIFEDGDRIEANVIFEADGNEPLDLWASGVLMSYRDGDLRCHSVPVVLKSERWRRAA